MFKIDIGLNVSRIMLSTNTVFEVVSNAPHRGGIATAMSVFNCTVDPDDYFDMNDLRSNLTNCFPSPVEIMDESVVLMTAVPQEHARIETCCSENGYISLTILCTAGLENTFSIGDPVYKMTKTAGTINLVVCINHSLSESAQIELLTMIAQARTIAVAETGRKSPIGGKTCTGTGTNCIALCSLVKNDEIEPITCAGMYTEIGCLVGKSVRDIVHETAYRWINESYKPS